MLQGLLRKRLLPMEHGVAKAKRIVASCNTATAKSDQDAGSKSGSKDQSYMKVRENNLIDSSYIPYSDFQQLTL